MMVSRQPRPALRPFVKTIWTVSPYTPSASSSAIRKRVLPTGSTHQVFRLSPHPLRILKDINDRHGRTLSSAIVGGARVRFYLREVAEPICSVGAERYPGAA